ncbi:MAG: tetratricopeptide repeat protein, partial [Verrucomicrobia bacterium]|nr:tetratricopeptide repeat protein [Verrucomicrobiota bacterium]
MQPRIRPNQYWGVTAAGLLLLLTGCTSLQRASSPIQLELSERDLYQVRALAHFGQALIYEDADGAISPRTLAAYTDAAELDPVYHPIFAKMATAHLISNRADEAIAILERSCKATPNSVMARMDLASAYHYLGNTNAAVNHFQKALAMDPTNTPIYFTLASLLIEAKRYDKAIELIERGLQHADQPERLRTYAYSLGLEFIERGDSIHSLAFFRLVVEYAQTKKSEIYHLMGQLYEGFNMRQEAIDCYESA